MNEEWREIEGFNGSYFVSNKGNVGNKNFRILSPQTTGYGYKSISLSKNNKAKSFSVHRLVASAFIGNCIGFDVNHLDGNRVNNCLDNLEIVTRRENVTHAKRTGLVGAHPTESGRWRAGGRINGDVKYMGTHDTEIEAHEKYMDAVIKSGDRNIYGINKEKEFNKDSFRIALNAIINIKGKTFSDERHAKDCYISLFEMHQEAIQAALKDKVKPCINSDEEVYKDALEAFSCIRAAVLTHTERCSDKVQIKVYADINKVNQALSNAIKEK